MQRIIDEKNKELQLKDTVIHQKDSVIKEYGLEEDHPKPEATVIDEEFVEHEVFSSFFFFCKHLSIQNSIPP